MKILLATEGSEYGLAAVEKCCEIFGTSADAKLMIISAAEPTYVPAEPFAISAEYIQEANKLALEKAKSAVAGAAQRIRAESPGLGSGLETRVLEGEPEQVILEEAEKWGADLIIMGSHGYGFWNRTFLGSVSNAVMHHAPCSVLVVRKKALDGSGNGKPA